MGVPRKLEQGTVGKLEFVRELGRGGMGIVYLARDVELQRFVAVKVLASNWLTDEGMVERFRREARTIASLRHPAIVHVHGVGKADDLHYFVMDFIEGVSLSQILRAHGPLSLPAVQTILYQVGSALSYAHRPGRGVIHRDVKPGNIMVDVEGNPVVMDFGISKVTEAYAGLTMTGVIMGTPEYMSPEQCRGTGVTQASDQYALGSVLYAMLAGSPPFTGPHYEVLVAHTTQTPPSILASRPDCPTALVDAMVRMLEKIPTDRWPDIKDALTEAGIRPPAPDDPGREELAWLVKRIIAPQPTTPYAGAVDAGRTPTWLRILELPEPIELGDKLDLGAVLGFADGKQIPAAEQISWVSTDSSVATVDPNTGQLVAVGAGSTVITANAAGVSGTVAVAVGAPRVVALAIEPDGLEIELGESAQLTAQPRSRNDKTLERTVLWSSSDPRIVTMGEGGGIHAYGIGSVHVMAHCDGVGATTTIRVRPAQVASLKLVDFPESMNAGDTVLLRAEARGKQDRPIDADVAWSTGNVTIARISPSGVLKALVPGVVHVTAVCEGHRAAATITVRPAPAASIALVDARSSIQVDERVRFRVATYDRNGNVVDRQVGWMSGDPSVLDVDAAGGVRGLRAGKADVVATCDGLQARAVVEVRPMPTASVALSPAPSQLLIGDSFHLTAQPLNSRGQPVDREVTWQVDPGAVVQPLGEGRFLAVAAGDAAVTAGADGVSAVVRLTVEQVAVRAITLRNAPETLEIGARLELQADVRDQRNRILQRPVHLKSSDPRVARISANGLLEVIAPGRFAIIAECEGVRASARIEALGTVVAPFPPPVPRREQAAITATSAAPAASDVAGPANPRKTPTGTHSGTPRRRPGVVSWGIGALALALVVTVVLIVPGGTEPPPVAPVVLTPPVTDVVVLDVAAKVPVAGDIEMVVGDTLPLRASAVDASGTAVPVSIPILSSRDPLVATIDVSGALIALAPGATTLIARASGIERKFAVRVSAASIDEPGPTPGPPPVADGVLRLVIQPWASVTIDRARRIDEVQRREFRLAPGTHTLLLENPNTMTIDTTFDVTSSKVTSMRIVMPPKEP